MIKACKIIIISIITTICFTKEKKIEGQDVSVSINETMLNNFFQSIGDVSGKGSTKVLGKKVKYNWKVIDPKVVIEPGLAIFMANVQIKSGKIQSTPRATSKLDISYVIEENLIKIKTKKINVDLMIKIFGKKVKLATLDLSKYYKPTFEFPGPTLNQKQIEIEKPDGTTKILNIKTDNYNLVLEQGRIAVYSDIIFSQK
tara:strand:- start:54 stop:653 length:600 start_codon:yes stop_codon:yes gene_type:complete